MNYPVWDIPASGLLIAVISFLPLLFNEFTFWGLLLKGDALLASAGALVPIMMIPFLPILGIAAYTSVKLYRLTGNFWLAGFLNALLVTMLTVANTSFTFPY